STSASGMKSTQRTMCSLVPCAKAGARWVARIPAIPVSLRNDRRSIGPLLVVDDALAFVDLLEFGLRPLHGVLGRRALLALVVLDLFLLPLGDDVDGRAVERGRDLAGVEGAVVVRVVPRQSALVAAFFPEGLHELHGLDGALAVQDDLLARLVGLGGAE